MTDAEKALNDHADICPACKIGRSSGDTHWCCEEGKKLVKAVNDERRKAHA